VALERRDHLTDDAFGRQAVPQCNTVAPVGASGPSVPIGKFGPCVGGVVTTAVEEGELSLGAVSVIVEQHIHRLVRGGTASQ